jgi:pimeloyl-ACP methyl ester carboxylesterase
MRHNHALIRGPLTRTDKGVDEVSSVIKRIAVVGGLAAGAIVAPGSATAFADNEIRWQRCGDEQPASLQCGTLSVPLDYDKPNGARIKVAFNRLPAADRKRRIGSLIVNPGGPGVPGTAVVAVQASGAQLWDPALVERFDLIGLDPRGVGDSTPVRCDPAVYNRPVSRFPRTQAEFDRLSEWSSDFGASCLKLTGPLLAHVDTGSVARDLERLRQALGDGKLNFLGLSYGAHVGATYAELYPTRIRAMALDSIANHSASINALFAQTNMAYEDQFNRFATWCEHADECALHGRDVGAVFDALVARADREPIPAPDCEPTVCRASVTGGELRANTLGALLFKDGVPALGQPGWRDLASALAAAEQGNASPFAFQLAQTQQDFAADAVNCVDYPWRPLTFAGLASKALMGRMIAPHTQGAGEAWPGMLACQRWPVGLARPRHDVDVQDAPPILLVHATHDPQLPYTFAHEMHDQIARSVLLTRDGDGHTTSWLSGGRTRDAIARYLITLQTPPDNTVYPE